jgi:hypothetical protein
MSPSIERYRKKPVVIEAVQLDEGNFYAVGDWAGVDECWDLAAPKPALFIDTLEGRMKAFIGDWIIKGVQGEFYPCKPDIFEATYEPFRKAPESTADAPTPVSAATEAHGEAGGAEDA